MPDKFPISNFQFPINFQFFNLRIRKFATHWRLETGDWRLVNGFTLVELLVVISILGILASIALVSFGSSQSRGRDAERKSDLKQMSSALELFHSDYGKYPDDSGGSIMACPTGTLCVWGSGQFSDGKTIYFKTLPKDPVSDQNYYYRIVDSPANQKFQLFAYLENTQDLDLISPPTSYLCGGGTKYCNFAITSSNTKSSE